MCLTHTLTHCVCDTQSVSHEQTHTFTFTFSRPKSIDEVKHQPEAKALFETAKRLKALPHLLLHGPPGSGKSSIALAFCKEVFGSHFSLRVLELNASDERGIDTIRNRVKTWSSYKIGASRPSPPLPHTPTPTVTGHSDEAAIATPSAIATDSQWLPEYKVVILDEADAMTIDAQSALRRLMEDHSAYTRFILICNYVTKIISPIASRCIKVRFDFLPAHIQEAHLSHIAQREKLNLGKSPNSDGESQSVLELLVAGSGGDMRTSINMLQTLGFVASARAKLKARSRLEGETQTQGLPQHLNPINSEVGEQAQETAKAEGEEAAFARRILGFLPPDFGPSLYAQIRGPKSGSPTPGSTETDVFSLAENTRDLALNSRLVFESLVRPLVADGDTRHGDAHGEQWKIERVFDLAVAESRALQGASILLQYADCFHKIRA